MQISTVRELGLLVRDVRQARSWTQAQLAEAAGVSRRWVYEFEAGKKEGAELDRVLRVLSALELVTDVSLPGEHRATEPATDPIDLDVLLDGYDAGDRSR
jgi:HTH-type transcriptional regulator/antitoxin HipB